MALVEPLLSDCFTQALLIDPGNLAGSQIGIGFAFRFGSRETAAWPVSVFIGQL